MSGEVRELTVTTSTVGSAIILSASGEVDIVSAPKLSATVSEALATGSSVLVLELSEVSFFGSAGLSVLVEALRTAATDQQVKVVGSMPVQRPIELTGLDKMLDVHDTLEDALRDRSSDSA
ncbi:STAS domain-containing protein [Nocardia sp. NPDC088792]|uniref:STAS domain-containing protein n=1 Tax=Nocardia sp. NPDC088792 TaxID=3364332 RepID=UPI00381BED80